MCGSMSPIAFIILLTRRRSDSDSDSDSDSATDRLDDAPASKTALLAAKKNLQKMRDLAQQMEIKLKSMEA